MRASAYAGHLSPADARMQVKDSKSGKPIGGWLSRGSVNWNAYRLVGSGIIVTSYE